MSVNEKLMAPGTFNVFLKLDDTPNSVINNIIPWGNIVLTPTRVSAEEFTDAQLRNMARYVGIVTSQTIAEEGIEVAGKGILTYLGDTDSRGMVLARDAGVGAVRSYNNDTLTNVIDRSNATPYGILRDESAAQRAVRKGTVSEVSFDDTVLLLNFEGTNGATTTTDGSAYTSNQLITFSNTASISNTQAKYGSTSLSLSTDGFVTVADRPELDLTYQDFTIEWWEYRTSLSGNPTVIARNNDNFAPYVVGKHVAGRNRAYITHDGTSYSATEGIDIDMGTTDLNQWNHFALTRKGSSFRTFKNGVIQQTDTRPDLFVRVSSDSLQIGKAQGGNFFAGFIDGLVITRGTAKYFDAFTPSTSAPTATTANKTYTGKHYMESAYKSLKTVATSLDCEFKMNNDGTIDVGPSSSLFTGHGTSTPEGMIVRRMSGPDPAITGYSSVDLSTEFVAEDYVSRVELIASNYGKEINLGQADAKSVPYKDLFGNELERIQILSENDVPDSLRNVRAEAYLNEYNKIQKTLSVGLEDYDVSGDIDVGDIIYVYDPEVGFEDTQADATLENRDRNEITYQGQILHPIKIRVMGLTFPIATGMGVYYRDKDGNYTDLTDYVQFEVGVTQIEVGSTTSNINQDLRGSASVIAVGGTNEFTVPDAPTGFAAAKGTYQDGAGRPFAFAKLSWTEPLNTDGSRITDGNMYRVRYRQVTDVDGNNLIDSNDNQITDFEYLTVEFGTTSVVIKGLGISNTYEFGVAAIDNSGFSGGFATITATQMPKDTIAPPEPVAPTGTFGSVASSAAKVQITHKLGAAKTVAGATIGSPTNFSLPRDIDHLNVYRGASSGFTVSASNFVGEIQARSGHIDLEIPAVNTFDVTTQGTAYYKVTAVDVAGNESSASAAASVTEQLIDTAFINDAAITTAKVGTAQITNALINDLSAAKITAGSITGKEIIIDTDTSDASNPVLGKIRSSNYSAGSAGWIINSDGSVEFSSGTFRGALAAATGTFAGTLSGVDGTFTGNISANQVTGGTLNFTSVTASNLDFSSLSVTSSQIINAIAENAILTKIADGAISQAKLGTLTVGNANITGTLDFNKITQNSVNIVKSMMAADSVGDSQIEDNAVGTSQLDLSNVNLNDFASADLTNSGFILSNSFITAQVALNTGGNVNADGDVIAGGDLQTGNRIEHTGATNTYIDIGQTSNFLFRPNGSSTGLQLSGSSSGGSSFVRSHWKPTLSASFDLGSSSSKWDEVFASNGSINTSDITLKDNVVTTDLGLDFVNDLTPIEFTWKDGGVRTHLGFSAQDVKEKLITHKGPDQNMAVYTQGSYETPTEDVDEDGNVVVETPEDFENYGLRPTELIPVLVKSIQELSAKIEALEG